MSKGGGTQTSTQNNDPWSGQQPYLTTGFAEAQRIYDTPGTPAYYPDSTVATPGATTNMAQQLQTDRALQGDASVNAGRNLLTSTINGDYLNSNPYLDANFAAGAGQITNAYNNAVQGQTSSFAGGNRLGSGMQNYYQGQQNDTLAKNLGDLYSKTYYADYNNERGNQMGAASMAPTYGAAGLTDLSALSDVGTAQDTYSQNVVNSDVDKWNYNQNLAQNKLANYMNMIQGNYGQSSTTTQKAGGGSGFGQMLGTAATIASFF